LDRLGLTVGSGVGIFVCLLILIGSQGLRHFDPALIPYALACIFSASAIAYRYTVWLQRPPTQRYWRQGWRIFWENGARQSLTSLPQLLFHNVAAQRFIAQRSRLRWVMHMCLSWGCMLAFALTIPLVFGWIHFEASPTNLRIYHVVVWGIPVQEFPIDSLIGFLSFNALNFSAVLVLIGVSLSLYRRLSDSGAIALQQFSHDIVPLLLLFAVAATGLGLTISAHWMNGRGFGAIALAHAVSVIILLLYFPFGKLFHVFQRSAHLGVALYKQAGQKGPQEHCARCHEPFASAQQVADLKQVLPELHFDYRLNEAPSHYQHVCPACRRRLLALNQGKTMSGAWGAIAQLPKRNGATPHAPLAHSTDKESILHGDAPTI